MHKKYSSRYQRVGLRVAYGCLTMKLFYFFRKEDLSGVSGTGPVVEGVVFTNGWCAVRWLSTKTSLCFYQNLEEVKAIHGHGDRTEIIVQDLAPLSKKKPVHSGVRFEILMQMIEQASRLMVLAEDPSQLAPVLAQSLLDLRTLLNRFERSFDSNPTPSSSPASPQSSIPE